jgi:uncharacterized membrane protein required for colicin V production
MYVSIALLIVFVSCVAASYAEGLWGNAIRLVNVVIAALLATNFFEPLAGFLEGFLPSYKYYWDFFAIWVLFAIFAMLLQTITNRLSRVNVRFLNIVDQVGAVVCSLLIGWVLVCFTAMTLHTAPLAKNFLLGSFQPREQLFFGTAPDRKWLAFTRSMSRGSLGRDPANVFDADRQFVYRYEERRSAVEQEAAAGAAAQPGQPVVPGK